MSADDIDDPCLRGEHYTISVPGDSPDRGPDEPRWICMDCGIPREPTICKFYEIRHGQWHERQTS